MSYLSGFCRQTELISNIHRQAQEHAVCKHTCTDRAKRRPAFFKS